MRPILLDTCAILWLANGDLDRFSPPTLDALRNATELCLCSISEWEIALKWRNGGIALPIPPRELMAKFVANFDVAILPLTDEAMFLSTELPPIHRDPADRFIIATALTGRMSVVTADRRFSLYGVNVIL